MSNPQKNSDDPVVNRKVLRQESSPVEPPKFRSWEEQSQSSDSSSDLSPPNKVRYKAHHTLPFWQNKDFQVIVAILAAVAIAYGVFRFLK